MLLSLQLYLACNLWLAMRNNLLDCLEITMLAPLLLPVLLRINHICGRSMTCLLQMLLLQMKQ